MTLAPRKQDVSAYSEKGFRGKESRLGDLTGFGDRCERGVEVDSQDKGDTI